MLHRHVRRTGMNCLLKKKEDGEQQRRRTMKKKIYNNKNDPSKRVPRFSTVLQAATLYTKNKTRQFEVKLFFNETAPVCLPRKLRTFARELFLRSSCLVPHLITWHHDYMGTNATAGDRKDHRQTSKLQTVFRDAVYFTGKIQIIH